MKETVLQSFLSSMPQAAAIWLFMLALGVIAAAALWLPSSQQLADDPDADGPGVNGPDPNGWDIGDPDADSGPVRRRSATQRGEERGAGRGEERGAGRGEERGAGRGEERGAWRGEGHGPWHSEARGDGAGDGRDWAHRYADEVAVATERAAVTARRRRAEWQAAQAEAEEMWATFEAAEQVARRSAAAAAFTVPSGCGDGDADRERYLHRAATAACRRRELTISELNDILAHRDGWDPRRHPAAQEAALHRAIRERWRAAYREAARRERQAWDAAELAAAALRSLREEACAARLRVGQRQATGQLWWAGQQAVESEATQLLPIVEPALSAPTVTLPVVGAPVAASSVTVPLPVSSPMHSASTLPVHTLDGRVWNGVARIPVLAGDATVTRSR